MSSAFFIDVFKKIKSEDQEENQCCSVILYILVSKNYLPFEDIFPLEFLTGHGML